jgi:hypothetical protein
MQHYRLSKQMVHIVTTRPYRTFRLCPYQFCFVFGRSLIHISPQRPAILIEDFSGFPRSLQANARILP